MPEHMYLHVSKQANMAYKFYMILKCVRQIEGQGSPVCGELCSSFNVLLEWRF